MAAINEAKIRIFEETREKFIAKLRGEELALLQNFESPTELVAFMRREERAHEEASNTRKILPYVQRVLQPFKHFGKALDVACNANLQVLSLLWGGLRLVICAVDRFEEFFDSIRKVLVMLDKHMSRLLMIEDLFSGREAVAACLTEVYIAVIEVFARTTKLFHGAEQESKKTVTVRRIHTSLKAMSNAFIRDTVNMEAMINELVDRLDREAQVASYKEAHEAFKAQREEASDFRQHRQMIQQALSDLKLENERNSQHRDALNIHGGIIRAEISLESDWREEERQIWKEQREDMKKVTAFVSEDTARKAIAWLKPASPEEHQTVELQKKYPGTCNWILNNSVFLSWLKKGPLILSINGHVGSGKTVLAASLIEHLKENMCPDEGIAFFYFDHFGRDLRVHLATSVMLLAQQNPIYMEYITERVSKAQATGRSPQVGFLTECLRSAAEFFTSIYIVTDALDECSDVDSFTDTISYLALKPQKKFRFLVTSRATYIVEKAFESLEYNKVEIDKSRTQADIISYVQGNTKDLIKRRRLKIKDPGIQNEITKVVSEKSDGMFLWAKCQFEQIIRLKTDKAIRTCLETLPRTLNETYLGIFRQMVAECEPEEVVQVHRLFLWLSYGSIPFNADQMAEAISIDFAQRSFDRSAVFTNPTDILTLSRGLVSLLTISNTAVPRTSTPIYKYT